MKPKNIELWKNHYNFSSIDYVECGILGNVLEPLTWTNIFRWIFVCIIFSVSVFVGEGENPAENHGRVSHRIFLSNM